MKENNNKKKRTVELNEIKREYRDREDEILFLDLREMGSPFEKKYIQLLEDDIEKVASTYHDWQLEDNSYEDEPEFCYSASIDEVRDKDYSLVPSKYIEFVNRDEIIDFDEKMTALQSEFSELLKKEEESKKELQNIFKDLGYEIRL
jgi:type I restriction enzyme M protein